ncbi:MAG: nickel pincer cofactor biosynthesis protein LarB [Victivallales bacterium]|nr:nickel pincer cofactor biosynthesis protein LarB [Victivallales bacterium]
MWHDFKKIAALLEKGIGDLGYARIDHTRCERCGFPEVIYGEGKNVDQITGIVTEIKAHGAPLLCTRIDADKAAAVKNVHPELEYCPISRCLLHRVPVTPLPGFRVALVTAGTSDLPVALEAKHTLELVGIGAALLCDVGVAGLHRLLARLDELADADVIIAIAGMEGALPSVIGGLVPCPVIAVPTSIGYGVASGGFAALAGMLGSCASGMTVVNIDNGFGAACAAIRLSRLVRGKHQAAAAK